MFQRLFHLMYHLLLTSQDKFEIILYMYKNEFGYEAMAKIIDKYKLDDLKYVAGETKAIICYYFRRNRRYI